jgi:hypothetical protein
VDGSVSLNIPSAPRPAVRDGDIDIVYSILYINVSTHDFLTGIQDMTCDPSEMTPRDRSNNRRLAIWTMLWTITLIGTLFLVNFHREFIPAGTIWVVAALPLVVAVGAMWSWVRYLREADELHRRVQLNAMAFGFGVSFFSLCSYIVLVRVGAPTLEVGRYTIPGVGADVLALLYGKWPYR